jgi:hypothetical protein
VVSVKPVQEDKNSSIGIVSAFHEKAWVSGHGLLDLTAYDAYLSGKLQNGLLCVQRGKSLPMNSAAVFRSASENLAAAICF